MASFCPGTISSSLLIIIHKEFLMQILTTFRGHMVPFADFVFAPQRQSTMVFTNICPQWQTFNGGNWNYLEQDLRHLTQKLNMDFVVYTGTYVRCSENLQLCFSLLKNFEKQY